MKSSLAAVAVVAFAGTVFGTSFASEPVRDDHEKIEKAMKVGFKGGLSKKIIEGKATAAEKEQFLSLVVAMWGTKVEHGSAESWKQKSSAVISAAASVVAGDPKGPAKLKVAANCKSCHSVHKPKK